jgi:hypothetical protein
MALALSKSIHIKTRYLKEGMNMMGRIANSFDANFASS